MELCTLYLEIEKLIPEYFQDFCDFIFWVIKNESQKYKTLEGFFEALYFCDTTDAWTNQKRQF